MEAAMNPFDLLQSPLILLIYALLILAVLKVVAPHGIDLDEILELPMEREWPRGIQEEEPVRWKVELLHTRINAPVTGTAKPAAQPNAPART
jgi:hypothetical protein